MSLKSLGLLFPPSWCLALLSRQVLPFWEQPCVWVCHGVWLSRLRNPTPSCLTPSVRFGRWQCPHWTGGALNWDAERGYDFNPPGPQTTQMSNVRKVLRAPSLSAGLTLPVFCQGHSPIIYYINTCWVDQQSRAQRPGYGDSDLGSPVPSQRRR